MKKIISIVTLIFILVIPLFSQQPKPRILGVVMGISKYQNVPSLRYADRDAMSFYNFLLSPAGGGADTNNIRLLLNEKATSYNFFEAMDNLLDMAKEGDQVYIYFAGHGDIEKKTDRQNGFLIGYNAPANCYASGGCIMVRMLQDYIETLVTTKKSKVTMIIDACRSGKLAGGAEGAEVTALALKAEWKGVTKILSCQPGETSLEGEQWGGGAGVFTYFMLKGMLGQADNNGDGKVTAMELGTYLDKIVMQETHEKQLPEVVGDKRQEITRIDKKHALALLNQMERPISLPPEKQSAGFETDVSSINDISVLKEYEKFKFYINNNNLIAYNDKDSTKETALSIFHSLGSSHSAQPILSKMKGELLAALQNNAQASLNGLISGNIKRVDDNSVYKELSTALSLVTPSDPQYNSIKYFHMIWKPWIEKDTIAKIKLLEECIRAYPDDPFSYLDLGCYCDDIEKSLNFYKKAIELSKNWFLPKYNIGLRLSEAGKYEEAVKWHDESIKDNPNFAWSWHSKGFALQSLKNNEEALICYNKAIELDSNFSFPLLNKGGLLLEYGKPDEALACFDKALIIDSNFAEAYIGKANLFFSLNKFDEALYWIDKAIKLNPSSVVIVYNKGMILSRLKRYEEAIQHYDKVLKLKPDYYQVYDSKGYRLFTLGKHDEGLKCIDKALEINPGYANAWYNKACCNALMKNKPEMLKYLKKAIELDPKKYKVDAPKDEDFKEYWNDPDFMELVK
jgi:protein O-mannosyl-transferase